MQLATVGPATHAARAQLILCFAITALLAPILIGVPRPNHGLTFDMGMIAEELGEGMTIEHSGWLRPYIRSNAPAGRFAISDRIEPLPAPWGRRHRLDLLPSGELLFDSRPVDSEGLRSRLDWLMTRTSGWVDFHPDPEARYEDVVEALAPVARSAFDRLRLDNSRYAGAFEAAAEH